MTDGWPCLVVILVGVKLIGVVSPSSVALNLVANECVTVGGGGAGLVDGFFNCTLESVGVELILVVIGGLIIAIFWFWDVCLSKLDDIFGKLVWLGALLAGSVCGAVFCNWPFLTYCSCSCAGVVVFLSIIMALSGS